jgi:uncharacterized membrane-anchored protein YjiN (DUF445 family)
MGEAARGPDAAERRRRLRRAKAGAAALLAAAAVALVAARLYPEPSFVAALARAAAEAAIVGGLADWFAVTALFRRPLGLPIPHTGLIPRRKDEIGRALGAFVSEQFLAPEPLLARLRSRNRALQLARWLDSPQAAAFLGERLVALVPAALAGAGDARLRGFLAGVARESLHRIDLRPAIDGLIDSLVTQGRHMALADAVLEVLPPALAELREPLAARIGARTGRFFPGSFDRKIGTEMVQGFAAWIAAARTPGTEERRHLDAWLAGRIGALRATPDYGALIAGVQTMLAEHPAVGNALGGLWDTVKAELATADAAPRLGALAEQLVRSSGRLLADSPAIQDQVNAAVENLVVGMLAPWRAGIGAYIAGIVAGWDADKVVAVIELQVGRDLQYIRINGTLVGALIGAGLFLLGNALPSLRRLLPDGF